MQCLCPMVMDNCVKWWIFGHFDDLNQVNNLFTTGIKRENYEEFIAVARVELGKFLENTDKLDKQIRGMK